MVEYPPLPKSVSAPLGMVPVSLVNEIGTENTEELKVLGRWNGALRRIHIRRDMPIELQWQVLFHEQIHAFLDETGHRFTEDDTERICDAIATGRFLELRDRLEKRR